MKNYIVFNSKGEILRRVSCPADMALDQASGEDEWIMEGDADDTIHKVEGLVIVAKTQQELDDQLFERRQGTMPPIDISLNDATLNAAIDAYFLGRIDVQRWRIENYVALRQGAYPPMAEALDAQVKIAAGGSLALEGQAQLDTYNAACLAVKLRFPKV